MDLMAPGFQDDGIIHMVGKILQGIEMMSLLHVAQVVAEVAASKDSLEPIVLWAKLADKTIKTFAEQE